MRLILCSVIVAASLVVGYRLSSKLGRRKKLLSDFITMLDEADSRIRYTSESLASVFNNSFTGYSFSCEKPFFEQWTGMLEEYKGIMKDDDIDILKSFGKELGSSDIEAQQKHIALYKKMLSERFDSAREDYENKSRLYFLLPFCAGLALAVFLI